MRIDYPREDQIPGLRQLWKTAFGDTEDFLDLFFGTAFSPDRYRCIVAEEQVIAALYWFDCECAGQKYAYLYAVATHPDYRGQGLCRRLMENTHGLLRSRGYAGAVLVPQETGLRTMYASMGYREATCVSELFCNASEETVDIRLVNAAEYALLRRQYLPADGVVQEGENLAFLNTMAKFYAGEDFLLAAAGEKDSLWAMELLGNLEKAPGILKTLGYPCGTFRTLGDDKPFAMDLPLNQTAVRLGYFGLAFD